MRATQGVRSPDYNYRPNHKRAIFLTAELSDEFAARVLPEILALRSNGEPITVYINSPGGSLPSLDTIHGALTCDDADNRTARIITVALGEAASAAATMLVLGDYAIVHPHSIVHFHGARYSDIGTMTMEHASSYASRLLTLNRSNAQKMARRSIGRVVRRYVQLLPEISNEHPGGGVSLKHFIDHLTQRTSNNAVRVIERTMSRIENAEALSAKILGKKRPKSANTLIKTDAAVLKSLIDYEVGRISSDEVRMDELLLSDIMSDYSLIRDYHLGDHYRQFGGIIRSQGPALLNAAQQDEFETRPDKDDSEATIIWLAHRVGPKLRELWHYSVLLCRELQSGENRLTAEDVYWLGCVDEVIGSDTLLGERADAEAEMIINAQDSA